MTAETHLYFPLQGNETNAYVKVRLFKEDGSLHGEATVAGPQDEGTEYEYPSTGDAHAVLRDARDFAAGRGFDVRVQMDGVDWDPDLGVLVEPK